MIKRVLKIFVLLTLILAAHTGPVFAAKPVESGRPGGSVNLTGNDVSWPQCGKTLPTNQAFGIVGVNGGLATNTNSCLSQQLVWAHNSSGATKQSKAQLYVNTANPGQVIHLITTWPTNNVDPAGEVTPNPYGECDGTNSLACSWQYGWNRAVEDVIHRFLPAAETVGVDADPAHYTWWLDVETENTWQEGSATDLAKNTATLEGMTAYFNGKVGARVGIYSTHFQWSQIVGNTVSGSSNLNGKNSWLAGGRSQKDAISKCSLVSLTAGSHVSLVQYVSKNLDHDVSCL